MSLSAQRAVFCTAFSFVACLATAGARAGDSPSPIAPSTARCHSYGEGYFGVRGSDACIRISGYVAAGADFSTSRGGRDTLLSNPGMTTGVAAALDSRFDTPAGPARVYIQVGRSRFAP
jgi:hypothetical protein